MNVRSLHRARTTAGIIAAIMLLAVTFCVHRVYAAAGMPEFQTVKQIRYTKSAAWLFQEPKASAPKAVKLKKSRKVPVSYTHLTLPTTERV